MVGDIWSLYNHPIGSIYIYIKGTTNNHWVADVMWQDVWLICCLFGVGYSKSVCWKAWFQICMSSMFVWFLWYVEMFLLKICDRKKNHCLPLSRFRFLRSMRSSTLFTGQMGTCDFYSKIIYNLLAKSPIDGWELFILEVHPATDRDDPIWLAQDVSFNWLVRQWANIQKLRGIKIVSSGQLRSYS